MRISYFPAMLERDERVAVDYGHVPVLLVDDEPAALELCVKLLKRLGFTDIDTAEDGVAALQKMMDRKYAVVISDWNMPVMNGLDLLRTIRNDDLLRRTPFLMTSVDGGLERARIARQAGVNAFLIKPFDAMTLKAKLHEVIGRGPVPRAA
jgi:two-component system, chemotaxis family, chemotaxis protein CheY